MQIAIIGAGITGSIAANVLSGAGHQVSIFDKARGRGGRCSRKQTDWGQFNMGAPVIPATDKSFISFMQSLCAAGQAERLLDGIYHYDSTMRPVPGERHYYRFVPAMNSICHHWTQTSQFLPGKRIETLQLVEDKWSVKDDEGKELGSFDKVLVTAPWPQTQSLLKPVWEQLQADNPLPEAQWQSCYSIAVQLNEQLNTDARLVYCQSERIQVLARQERAVANDADIWVAYLDNHYSDKHPTLDKPQEINKVLDLLRHMFGASAIQLLNSYVHKWRYARVHPDAPSLGIFHNSGLYAAGDWSFGASVQNAVRAGNSAASLMLGQKKG